MQLVIKRKHYIGLQIHDNKAYAPPVAAKPQKSCTPEFPLDGAIIALALIKIF